MRRILVDHARRHRAAKRGASVVPVRLEEGEVVAAGSDVDMAALDDVPTRLMTLDARQARVIEQRHFTWLGIEESAEALGISPATVKREWAMERAWPRREPGEA
jgi:RNA polymerase sigma factor (TIGR02999 family)